jgi:hypothetical protein
MLVVGGVDHVTTLNVSITRHHQIPRARPDHRTSSPPERVTEHRSGRGAGLGRWFGSEDLDPDDATKEMKARIPSALYVNFEGTRSGVISALYRMSTSVF